ncbi:MAG: complex I NDUFA9 subunit family protein [Tepidisphaeraceae bacterium]
MNVFVTGGSGFVGQSVIDRLVAVGHEVVALKSHRPINDRGGKVRTVEASLFDVEALTRAMTGCEATIHLVGIISQNLSKGVTFERMHVEATRAVVSACEIAKVRRYVHMSALGARPDAPAEYHRTKARAEAIVRQSHLDWTILRPSMIHGPRGDFTKMLVGWARKQKAPWLFMPYFGRGILGFGGAGKLQPIFVEDVATAFVRALDRPQTIHNTYDLAGSDVVTWPQLYDIAARVIVGKRRAVWPIPAWYGRVLTSIVPEKGLMGVNRDQVEMSQEDNTADIAAFRRDFEIEPQGFERSFRGYAEQV